MSVRTITPEGENQVRAIGAERAGNASLEFLRGDLGQHPIDVVPALDLVDAKSRAGQAQLRLAHLGEGLSGRQIGRPNLAGLAARRTDHYDVATSGGVARERATGAKRLIVRMGVDAQPVGAQERAAASWTRSVRRDKPCLPWPACGPLVQGRRSIGERTREGHEPMNVLECRGQAK
jgi:hypothetical protein